MLGAVLFLQYVAQADAFAFAKVFKLFSEGSDSPALLDKSSALMYIRVFANVLSASLISWVSRKKRALFRYRCQFSFWRRKASSATFQFFFFNSRHDNLVTGIDHIAEILYRITVKQTPAPMRRARDNTDAVKAFI